MKGIYFLFLCSFVFIFSAEAKKIKLYKNIAYELPSVKGFDPTAHTLDIYAPVDTTEKKEVLVFIHGGSWNSGKKETYRFFGKGFAKKGQVVVIINYRLLPKAIYTGMAMDCASAVKWVYENIDRYGGDKNKIFISGHSAGGHLAALISTDHKYFDSLKCKDPVKGIILIDAFGLDIYSYLKHGYPNDETFRFTFTRNAEQWKKASPLYSIKPSSARVILFRGGRTYPAIITDAANFHEAELKAGNSSQLVDVKKKKHIGMIIQFFNRRNPLYARIIDFMKLKE